MAPNKDAKRPSPALVDSQALLDFHATMGTRVAVTTPLSRLHFSRVVLDFLLCCHNLEMISRLGDALRSFHGLVRPLFHFPSRQKNHDRSRVKKEGRGPILRKMRAGSKQGCQRGGVRLREQWD